MTGVEILNTTEVATEFEFNMAAAVGSGIGGILIVMAVALIMCAKDGLWISLKGWLAMVAVGVAAGVVFGTGMGFAFEKPIAYETHYDVCISEEVSMIEFSEKYEIVDTNGKIFTIREK